jgi:hypothetical protein
VTVGWVVGYGESVPSASRVGSTKAGLWGSTANAVNEIGCPSFTCQLWSDAKIGAAGAGRIV